MDYGDVIYDQRNNDSFTNKIDQLQYKPCQEIQGAMQEISQECRCNELNLGSLCKREWCRKLCTIFKLLSTQCPKYLCDIMPSTESFYDTHKKNRPFSVAELIASNILSFQILYLNCCNLRQKYKTQSLLQF